MVTLHWRKCAGNVWCPFMTAAINHAALAVGGVYIIWHGGQEPRTVRVGQGNVRDRLSAHRGDPEITRWQHLDLYVTWAAVTASQRDGVERYLAEQLNPIVGSRFPDVPSIQVNLPW